MSVLRIRRVAPSLIVACLLTLVGAGAAHAADRPLIAPPPPGGSTAGPLVGVTADDGARVVAEKWLDPSTVDLTVRSPAMKLDLPVRVVVPPGWSTTTERTWPLVLALHGGGDDWTSWTRETDIATLARASGVLVAMPEAGQTAAYTDYVRTTPQGPLKWETFHTVELLQILERGLGAGDRRAVVGISAGGYGAVSYAARHPGLFRFVATYSGMLAVNQFPLQQAILAGDALQSAGTTRYGTPLLDQRNWDAHDPYKLVANLRGVGLYVHSGLSGVPSKADTVPWTPLQFTEGWIGWQNTSFVAALKKARIPVTSSFALTGEHDWANWEPELHRAWPLITGAIGG